MNVWSQKLTQTYYPCLESANTVPFKRSFLLTLAPKTETCIMALLVLAWSKFSPNPVEIPVPYRLSMGSWLGIDSSSIDGVKYNTNGNLHPFGTKHSKQPLLGWSCVVAKPSDFDHLCILHLERDTLSPVIDDKWRCHGLTPTSSKDMCRLAIGQNRHLIPISLLPQLSRMGIS